MTLHEHKKCAKIIEEITEYVLGKGYKKIDSSMELKKTETTIVITVYTNGRSICNALKQDLSCSRDVELEEYGWELTDNNHSICSLDALGLLVDKYEIKESKEKCVITLHRFMK